MSYFDDPGKVGARIRAAREAKDMSQRELAFPGCTAAYISRIEHGERVPSLQILREFARRLGVSESFLARGEEEQGRGAELWLQAKAALALDETETARELADTLFDSARDDRSRARATAILAQIAYHDGDHDRAIEALERARKLDGELEMLEPDLAETLGRAYARRGEYDGAIAVFIRNYEAAKASSAIEMTRFGSLLANAYVDTGDFVNAESVLAETVAAAEELRDPVARARVLWAQSRMRTLQNDSEAALRYATAAVELLELSAQDYHAARGYQLLAHIELDRGNPERAVELLERGWPLLEAHGRPFEQASFRLEQVRALIQSGQEEEAGALAMTLAPMFEQGRPIDSGRSYALLADVFRQLGDEERAIELYELAIERFEGMHNRYVVEAYNSLAEIREGRGQEREAFALLKRAMQAQRAATPTRAEASKG